MILPWVSLFPGGLLPLRIFEDRYRLMLKDALDNHRMFAIAHVDETLAGKFGMEWESIGTLGVLRACVTNEDGTSNLILQGVVRVRFTNHGHEPYPEADIEILRDSNDTTEHIDRLRALIQARVQNPPDGKIVLPKGFADHLGAIESPASFADMLSSTAITNPINRRLLLDELDVASRLELLSDFLLSGDEDWNAEPENLEAETGEE